MKDNLDTQATELLSWEFILNEYLNEFQNEYDGTKKCVLFSEIVAWAKSSSEEWLNEIQAYERRLKFK